MTNEEMLARLGLEPDATDDDLKDAFVRFMEGVPDEEEMAKFRKFSEGEDDKEDDEEAEAMAKMAKNLDLPADAKPRAILAALQATRVPVQTMAKMRQELDAMKAERAAEKEAAAQAEAEAIADDGVRYGYPEEQRADLVTYARTNPDGARKLIAGLPGRKAVMTRFTSGGKPLDTEREQRFDERGETPKTADGIPIRGVAFSKMSKEYAAKNNVSLREAQRAVAKEHPEVAREAVIW